VGFSPAHLHHHRREQGEFEAEATLDTVMAALVLLNRGGAAVRLLLACGPARHPSVYRAASRHGLAARCFMRSSDNPLADAPASTLMELYVEAPLTSAFAADKLQFPAALSLTAVLHARADIMIFPQVAINSAAGPPRQLLQAMARGCVVAAADTAAHREVIEHGRNGVLFAPNDAGALADAVKVLLEATPRWPDMRASARWLIEYHRNWEGCVAMYGPIYEKLLAGKRRR
jgi:glycosyltransferase involved in cell wall biosynthesis